MVIDCHIMKTTTALIFVRAIRILFWEGLFIFRVNPDILGQGIVCLM